MFAVCLAPLYSVIESIISKDLLFEDKVKVYHFNIILLINVKMINFPQKVSLKILKFRNNPENIRPCLYKKLLFDDKLIVYHLNIYQQD